MTDGEFPFRSFTMRPEGYDSSEVDSYVEDLRSEILELRRALETAMPRSDGGSDTRLHDPEGAVTRTLAIAQETADRVLHDAQVEADQRRSEADEHAIAVIAEADERAARLLGDMEAQAAEVREQGVAAARSAIQVERDKAMAELAHVRRVRNDLRTEAVELKDSLDRYRSQAREASDTLAAAASGPLMSLDLPNYIDDEVVLAGIVAAQPDGDSDEDGPAVELGDHDHDDEADAVADGSYLHAVEDDDDEIEPTFAAPADNGDELAEVISIDADSSYAVDDPELASDLADDLELASDLDDVGSGTFLAEVRAAAEDDVALPPENDDSDRFLSELRGIADEADDALESDAADTFFDDED